MSALLQIEVGRSGVERVISRPRSIAEASQAAELSAKTVFGVRLLHEVIAGDRGAKAPVSEFGDIFVQRGEGDLVEFQRLPLGLAYRPHPIDFRRMPAWLIAALRKVSPNDTRWQNAEDRFDGGESEVAWMILNHFSWIDHAGLLLQGKTPVRLVSEPYGLTQEQMTSLLKFCEDSGLRVQISGISNHAPSRTIRIEIFPAATSNTVS